MDIETKKQLARELAQVTIASLAASTGALFTDPTLAAVAAPAAVGAGTLLSRLLDRFDLGQTGHNYIETAHSKLLDLAEQHSDEEVGMAFATALEAIKKFGLTARQFAILDFDAHKAAIEVARTSGYHNLWREDEREQPTLAFQCLETLYESYRDHQEHSDELERAFQNELLARTQDLRSLGEELRPLAEALLGPSLLEIPTRRFSSDASPTTLLSPRYQILPYQSRVEDEAFDDWLEQDADHSINIATVQAPGGSGKTRWLLEHCRRRNSLWRAGFLRKEDSFSVLATYQSMLNGPQKVLVVVDYVEDRPEQLIRLLNAAVHAVDSGARHLRIVLLCRNLTQQWWDNLRPQLSDRARGWVTRDSQVLLPVDLKPLNPIIEDRVAIFETAVDVLRPNLTESADILNPPDLSPPFYSDPLFVQLAALSLLRGGDAPLNDMSLLEETLDHEAKYWVGDGIQRDQVEPILAVSTLWQGLDTGTLNTLIEKWPDRTASVACANPAKLAQRLRRLYPGENDGIAPILPDRLGEAVILRVLSIDPHSLAQVAFGPAVGDTHRKQAFSTLTRMPANAQAQLVDIGRILAKSLQQHPDVDFSLRLMAQLPEFSIGLIDLGEAAARTVVLQLESQPQDTETYCAQLARALAYHGEVLNELKRHEVALDVTQEAIKLYRQLADQRPDVFKPALAASLVNLACQFFALDQREAALEAAQESVNLFRQLADQWPDIFTPYLAKSLDNLGVQLSNLSQREAALEAAQESVNLFRQLAGKTPDAYKHDLASSLSSISDSLAKLTRPQAAFDTAQEAVELYRQLAEERPDAYIHYLARNLLNLANQHTELGQHESALDTAQEGTKLFRQLAIYRPDIFKPELTSSLMSLALKLYDLNHRDDALTTAQESLSLRRQLADQRPDTLDPNLGKNIGNLAIMLSALGQYESAVEAAQESVELFRQLADQRPQVFVPDLAKCILGLANRFSDLGKYEAALEAAQESVNLFRQLADQWPDIFTPYLAKALPTLSIQHSQLQHHEAALDASQEAVELYRQFTELPQNIYKQGLAGLLNNLASQLAALDQYDDARVIAEEAVDLCRQLSAEQPEAFNPQLPTCLHTLSKRLAELGLHELALNAAQEATNLFYQAFDQWPDAFISSLTKSLANLADCLDQLGQHKAALDARQEAATINRRGGTA